MVNRRKYGLFLLVILFVFVLLLFIKRPVSAPNNENGSEKSDTNTQVKSATYSQLSGENFKQIYDSVYYPNTEELDSPPVITGNPEADERIHKIASQKGYHLRSVPVLAIVKTEEKGLEGDDLLQFKANESWKQLRDNAKASQIDLKLTSAYRPISYQREIFLSRLLASGATAASIAAGQSDNIAAGVLKSTAPPGYSRHHTGYTVDVACGKIGLYSFKTTVCYRWLSADNYKKAREFGWIPSYPEGAEDQGPEPEPWEFVWVGTQAQH